MPVIKIDPNQDFEPIEVQLGDKTYTVRPHVTYGDLKSVEGDDIESLARVLGVDLEELKDVDIRVIGKVLRSIQEAMGEQSQGKGANPTKAKASK